MIWRRIQEHEGKPVYEAISSTGEIYRVGPSRDGYRAQTPEGWSARTVTVAASKRHCMIMAERRDLESALEMFRPGAQS